MRTTIEMAREAAGDDWGLFQDYMPEIHRLAELVRADEREACAKVAAGYGPSRPIVSKNPSSQIVGRWEGEQAASFGIEAAIRARSNT